MAKKVAEAEVASLNPADFLQGGLRTDFRGTVTEAVYGPWDYNGSIKEPVLGARLTIQPEGEDKPYTDWWSAGDLSQFVPSEDGRTPAEAEDGGVGVGPYALRVGKRPQLNNNTNFAHLMQTIVEAGAASKKFLVGTHMTSSLECLVGLDAHWDRVPQKKRSGMVEEEGAAKRPGNKDVLVVSSVYGYGDSGAKKAVVKSKAKTAEMDDDDDDDDSDVDPVDAKLIKIISAAIEENGKVKRGKLANIVLVAAAGDKDKSKMINRLNKEDFLATGPWLYDEDNGVLTAAEEE